MSTDIALVDKEDSLVKIDDGKKFVTMSLGKQLFGLPVEMVQDVLKPQKITKVPLSTDTVGGLVNLRGRIVTVINMHSKMGLGEDIDQKKHMNIVVEYKDELYSLIVDSVSEVMDLPNNRFEPTPPNLSQSWQNLSSGAYRLKEGIMLVLDIDALFNTMENKDEMSAS